MSEIKPKEIAKIVSDWYSELEKDAKLAAKILDKLAEAGVEEYNFDDTDDIISDANEYRGKP
jgi:hypothetical protein